METMVVLLLYVILPTVNTFTEQVIRSSSTLGEARDNNPLRCKNLGSIAEGVIAVLK